jgi:hypothetical protein
MSCRSKRTIVRGTSPDWKRDARSAPERVCKGGSPEETVPPNQNVRMAATPPPRIRLV